MSRNRRCFSTTRREFLKTSLAASASLVSLGSTMPAFYSRAAFAEAAKRDANNRVLVVVQLSGGNDGLNTVIPYDDDVYGKSRPTLRLRANQVLKINAQLGWHPRLEGFRRLYDEGLLSVVQGVGYPNPDRDHERSVRIWHTANRENPDDQTGWLGRTIDHVLDPNDVTMPAASVGPERLSFALHAEKAIVPAVRSLQDYTLHGLPGPEQGKAHRERLASAARLPRSTDDNPLLDFVRRGTLAACENNRRAEEVIRRPARAGTYPEFRFAHKLKTIAQLIRADLGLRIFFTNHGGDGFGGFDTHAKQADNHAALLRQLSESVSAFVGDLKREGLLDRVLLMTVSEFGRTVKENGRRGTNHGAAAPLFLVGGKLKGGLRGHHPPLDDLEGGDQKYHTDFRRVYAMALEKWLGFDSRAVLGGTFKPVDGLRV